VAGTTSLINPTLLFARTSLSALKWLGLPLRIASTFSYKDFKDDFKTANEAGISTPGVG